MSLSIGGNKPMDFDEWLRKFGDKFGVGNGNNNVGGVDGTGGNQPSNPFAAKFGESATIFDVSEAEYKNSQNVNFQKSGSDAASSSGADPMSKDGSVFQMISTVNPSDAPMQPPGVVGQQPTIASGLTQPSNNQGTDSHGNEMENPNANPNLAMDLYQEFLDSLKTEGVDGAGGTEGTDGTGGADGADGTDGTNGTEGTDGTNGTGGTNGTNGTEGTEGEPDDGTDKGDGNTEKDITQQQEQEQIRLQQQQAEEEARRLREMERADAA